MVKYIIAAQALRVFSLTPGTRRAYRALGNRVGGQRRSRTVNPSYIRRASENLAALESVKTLEPGMRILELGTGWVHWESLFTRLFHKVEVVAMDVWDNRQFEGLQRYCAHLAARLDSEVPRPAEQRAAARELLGRIAQCPDFDAVYAELDMQYVVEPSGRLDFLQDRCVDAIISSDVLEHVPSDSMATLAGDMLRVLKPGGVISHQVVPADHLCIYDRSAHPKQYLRYSDSVWRNFFMNEVQYFNRLQPSQFRDIFERAGFAEVRIDVTGRADLGDLKVSSSFDALGREDLECTVFRISARKPDLC